VVRAVEAAARLTAQLLDLGRARPRSRAELDIAELSESVLRLLRRSIPETVGVSFEVVEAGLVEADAGELERALTNLCLNARDAIEGTGRIAITMDRARTRGADWACIAVADDGCGMSAETRARLFEPFYTTKSTQGGTGLGLTVTKTTVREHGGFLEVESEPGVGSTIRVFLPLSEAAAARSSETLDLARTGPVVLVAEDDELVLGLVRRILGAAGYQVVCAVDGEAAVALVQGGAHIDFAVLDAVMPRLDGPQTYAALQILQPDLPVLFISGQERMGAFGDFLDAQGLPFLRKPFTRDGLVRAVDALMVESDL